MNDLIVDTPIEKVKVKGKVVYVKREDLACPNYGPPFAKVRGLHKHLLKLKDKGIKTVGYMDTSISMAGWGVSYFAEKLGLKAVIFYPKYKDGYQHSQEQQIKSWEKFNAEIIPLDKPNRQKINFYRARKLLEEKDKDARLLPLGLPFKETVEEVSKQVSLLDDDILGGTIVICIGSGTMASGVFSGVIEKRPKKQIIKGIFAAPKSEDLMKKSILKKVNTCKSPLFYPRNGIKLDLFDLGYEYTYGEKESCPFPCSPYYDRKAWKYLKNNIDLLKEPILFWNIGGHYKE